MHNLVVIPTYNERGNIGALISAIFEREPELHVLVVDDKSPDGTAAVVRGLQSVHPQLHLLEGEGKRGLGRAYIEGFRWALARDYEFLVQMDADFSHRPEDLSRLVAGIEQAPSADVLVGSRYVAGGGTRNWGWFRRLISRGGSLYSRWILGFPLADWTGGFNLWKKQVLEQIGLDQISSEGYSFQIEMKYRALQNRFRVKEVPILFEERRAGQSKMSARIVREALIKVWRIRFG